MQPSENDVPMDKDENSTFITGRILKKGTILFYKLVEDSHKQQATIWMCCLCYWHRWTFLQHLKKWQFIWKLEISRTFEKIANWRSVFY